MGSSLAIQLLDAVRQDAPTIALEKQLAAVPAEGLLQELIPEQDRRAFWINCYNAFTQLLIRRHRPDLRSQRKRVTFFGSREIMVAGRALSLNDIEHGMLRHSRVWWSMGYLPKSVVGRFERQLRVPLDYRIHFALNCGALSCPAIRFYKGEMLSEQLQTAEMDFVTQESVFDASSATVTISKIFSWYRADFGGKKGILNLLNACGVTPRSEHIHIRFKEYDWSVHLHKFEQ
jgi:hypothetical protein